MKLPFRIPSKKYRGAAPKAAAPAFVRAAPVAAAPLPLPGNLGARINSLCRRYRAIAVSTGLAMMVAAISLLLLGQGVGDWWLNFPWFARAGFLATDIVLLALLYRHALRSALRKRLTRTEAALLIEKKWPALKQSVVAAVQLSEGRAHSTRGSAQLVELTLERAQAGTRSLDFREVVSARKQRIWFFGAVVALGLLGAAAAYGGPASLMLLQRIFLVNVPLPTKTIVVPITADLAVPIGTDVELSAKAQGYVPHHGRVTITYADGAPQDISVDPQPGKPEVFSLVLRNVQSGFKYHFTLNDGQGPEFTGTCKLPPTFTGITCEQTFPAYTGLPVRKLAPTDLSLLAGSHLKLTAAASEPLQSAEIVLQGVSQTIPATLDSGGRNLVADIPIPVKDLTGFSIHLVGASGVSSVNETVYPILLILDNPPDVKVTQPEADRETVTLRAKPLIAFDASDDYGMESLTLNYEIIGPPVAGQEDAAPSHVQSIPIKIHTRQEGAHYEQVLDIAAQTPACHEGDTVNYWVEARDNNSATGPGITKTDKRQFSIISVEAKEQEIADMLRQNAADINALSDAQQKVSNDVGESVPQK